METNVRYYSMNPIQKIGYKFIRFFKNLPSNSSNVFKKFGYRIAKAYFRFIDSCRTFFLALVDGDIFTKLSFLFLGVGAIKRKQIVKGIIYLLVEALFIYALIVFMIPNLAKLNLKNLVQLDMVYNPVTGKNEANNYDNTFFILLYSIVAIIFIIAFIYFYIKTIKETYEIELVDRFGGHINTFKEDLNTFLNLKFHITLLTLPVLGVVIFTIIPLIFMICIAVTNYDGDHLPPTYLFE